VKAEINLQQLELSVRLGWPEEEREIPQTIWLDIQIKFFDAPSACKSDNLADTFCYDELIKKIKTEIHAREFRLIEYLGQEIYRVIKQVVGNHSVNIRIHKKPLIENLTGGVNFCFGDEAWSF